MMWARIRPAKRKMPVFTKEVAMNRPRRIALIAFLSAALSAWAEGTPPKVTHVDAPKRMLFVGNSFTYFNDGVPMHLKQLAVAADEAHASSYEYKMATISGAYLNELEPIIPSLVKTNHWDIVVLQGNSAEPIAANAEQSARFRASARAFDNAIHDAGSRTVLYMTWAYKDKPEMTRKLSEAYVAVGDELGALVVPVGLAFERSAREYPAINLYYADGKHPNLEGTYLAACVFYSALYGKSAEGNAYVAGLNRDTALTLQKTAWNTVKAFYSGPTAVDPR
jgi:uncharacterized protein DUF4886